MDPVEKDGAPGSGAGAAASVGAVQPEITDLPSAAAVGAEPVIFIAASARHGQSLGTATVVSRANAELPFTGLPDHPTGAPVARPDGRISDLAMSEIARVMVNAR